MKKSFLGLLIMLLFCPAISNAGQKLFILAGQSNMYLLDPDEVFTPAMKQRYGDDNVIVVHDAKIGKAISYWDEGKMMWNSLMWKLNAATEGKQIDSVTFIWMQGEDDSGNPVPYEGKLRNLFARMQSLFPSLKMRYIVGRINDWDTRETWMEVRRIQEVVCKCNRNYRLIDTDDLNGPSDDLHNYGMYDILAQRYVDAVISLDTVYMPGVEYLFRKKKKR